jgi:hypothetical protein
MGAARAARPLDCTLVYALVPNGSLDGLVREQARKVAAETVSRVDHSMKLEGQACRPERWKKSGNGWLKNCCGVRAGYGTSCERSRLIEKEMRRRSLYKYYSERKWAEEFLDGKLLFRSLAYFRDYEDKSVREDQNEGAALFRPEGGLIVNNLTQGKTFILPDHAFVSGAKQEEIFVFCTSRSDTDELRQGFKAVACVEILDIGTFCSRIEAALPPAARFPAGPDWATGRVLPGDRGRQTPLGVA